MSGAKHRRKGDRVEREIVQLLIRSGIWAERYPLSGASHFRDSGHDIDVYVFGRDAVPHQYEVKSRKDGKGFALIDRWLEECHGLITKANNRDPIVHINIHTFIDYLLRASRLPSLPHPKVPDRISPAGPRLQADPANKEDPPWLPRARNAQLGAISEKPEPIDDGEDNAE